MEINTVKQNNPAAGVLSFLLLAAGGALLGYSLYMLPEAPAYGFPWAFSGTIAAFLLLAAGGGWLCLLAKRRRAPEGYSHNYNGTVMFGIFVIIAGVMLLCFNFGALPYLWKRVFFSWQMLLLVISCIEFSRKHFVGGGVLLALGAFFIIRRLAPIYPDLAMSGIGVTFWPVLLIVLGIMIIGGLIFKPRRGQSRGQGRQCREGRRAENERKAGFSQTSGVVDISVIFGSNEQVYLDPVFQGGKISTVFGGVMLDLRRTELPEGDTLLKIEVMFGGVEIYAPEGWTIELRNESIFGGFADKRFRTEKKAYDDGRKLIIKSSSVFGGGEIK